MTIIIPQPILGENNKSYSLDSGSARKPIRLDIGDSGQDNPLFIYMVRYLLNPITKGDFRDVEKNLKRFLNIEFMEKAAENTADMEWNREDYENHVTKTLNSLLEMPIKDFLDEIRHRFRNLPHFGDDDWKILTSNLGDLDYTMKRYLDSHGFNTIIGKTRKDEGASKLRNIAETKSVYEDALNDIEDFIEIENTTNQDQIKLKTPTWVVEETKYEAHGQLREYVITIDTLGLFTNIFDKLNIKPKFKKAEVTSINEIAEDYEKNNEEKTFEITSTELLIDDIQEASDKHGIEYMKWFPPNLREKLGYGEDRAAKDTELEKMLLQMNLKYVWNEERKDFPEEAKLLDDAQEELLLILFNLDIMTNKSIYNYVTSGTIPSRKNWSTKEQNFFKKEVKPRALKQAKNLEPTKEFKTVKDGFYNEFEQALWNKHKKNEKKVKALFIAHASDDSKYNDRKLFEEPINYDSLKITAEGLKNLKKHDTSGEFKELLKKILNLESLGKHTIYCRVIVVDEQTIKEAKNYINGPTTDTGPYSKKSKELWKKGLDETWNVFEITKIEYKHEKTPYLGDVIELRPQMPRKERSKMTDLDWEKETKPRTSIPAGLSREEEGGSVGIMHPKNRLFHTYIRKQLKKLKRFVNG